MYSRGGNFLCGSIFLSITEHSIIYWKFRRRLPPPSPMEDCVDGADDPFLKVSELPRRTTSNASSSSNATQSSVKSNSTNHSSAASKPLSARELPEIHDVPYDSPPPPPAAAAAASSAKTKPAPPPCRRDELYSNAKIKKGEQKKSRQPGEFASKSTPWSVI